MYKVLTLSKSNCLQFIIIGFLLASCGKNQTSSSIRTDINALIVNTEHDIERHSEDKDLSKYWAQEYVGADLVRDEMSNVYDSSKSFNISVWDSSHENHDLKVINLISSTIGGGSSALNNYQRLKIIQTDSQQAIINNLKTTNLDCNQDPVECPAYINNSEHWNTYGIDKTNSKLSNELELLAKHSTLVTISGNFRGPMELLKENAAQKKQIVTVASVDELGDTSDSNNYSENITISAPSGNKLTSLDNKSEANFGGTSGAAPQVTSALLIFSLNTGIKLSPSASIALLQKTALPFPNYPSNTNIGKGILNTYKIFKVSKKLNEQCTASDQKEKCILEHLDGDDIYSFGVNKKEVLDRFVEIEKSTKGLSTVNDDLSSREKLFLILKDLRKIGLLEFNSPEIWDAISKIYNALGFKKNSLFYASLSERALLTDKQVNEKVKSKIKGDDYLKVVLLNSANFDRKTFDSFYDLKNRSQISLIIDALNKPFMIDNTDLVLNLVKMNDDELNGYLDNNVLSNEGWQSSFKSRYNISNINSRKIKWLILKTF